MLLAGVDQPDVGAELGGEELDHVVGERLGGRDHLALEEQEPHHVTGGAVDLGTEVACRRAALDDDLALGHGCGRGHVRRQLRRLELLELATASARSPLGRPTPSGRATATRWRSTDGRPGSAPRARSATEASRRARRSGPAGRTASTPSVEPAPTRRPRSRLWGGASAPEARRRGDGTAARAERRTAGRWGDRAPARAHRRTAPRCCAALASRRPFPGRPRSRAGSRVGTGSRIGTRGRTTANLGPGSGPRCGGTVGPWRLTGPGGCLRPQRRAGSGGGLRSRSWPRALPGIGSRNGRRGRARRSLRGGGAARRGSRRRRARGAGLTVNGRGPGTRDDPPWRRRSLLARSGPLVALPWGGRRRCDAGGGWPCCGRRLGKRLAQVPQGRRRGRSARPRPGPVRARPGLWP